MDCMGNVDDMDIFEKTFEYCAVGLAHVSPMGDFIRVNNKLSQFLGYDSHQLTKMSFQQLTPQPYLQDDMTLLHKVLRGEINTYTIEKKYLHAKGHLVWGRLTVSLVRDAFNQADYFISVVEDIDEKKRIESELFQAEALFSKIVAAFSTRTFVWVANPMLTRLQYVNEGYQNIYGRNEYELHAHPSHFLNYVHEDDSERVNAVYANTPLKCWDLQYRIRDSEGNIKFIHDRGMPLFDVKQRQVLVVGTADDVSNEKAQQQALKEAIAKLEHLSKTDPLTGISNRREMFLQLEREIKRMYRGQNVSTLVYVDLNDFKQINDDFGHKAGDKALMVFSKTVQQALRDTDRFARLGGDEFVLLLYGSDETATEAFLARLANESFYVEFGEGVSNSLTFSIGCSTWNSSIASAQGWIDAADDAMYQQKRQHTKHAGCTRE